MANRRSHGWALDPVLRRQALIWLKAEGLSVTCFKTGISDTTFYRLADPERSVSFQRSVILRLTAYVLEQEFSMTRYSFLPWEARYKKPTSACAIPAGVVITKALRRNIQSYLVGGGADTAQPRYDCVLEILGEIPETKELNALYERAPYELSDNVLEALNALGKRAAPDSLFNPEDFPVEPEACLPEGDVLRYLWEQAWLPDELRLMKSLPDWFGFYRPSEERREPQEEKNTEESSVGAETADAIRVLLPLVDRAVLDMLYKEIGKLL